MASWLAKEVLPRAWQVVLAAVMAALVVWAWSLKRMLRMAAKFPGPAGWPLLGNALSFVRGPEGTFRMIREMFEVHGPVVRLWLGPKLVICIASAEDAQLVLTHPKVVNRDPHMAKAVNTFIENSLITTRDEAARARRKLMAPAFHFKILANYLAVFACKGEELCERLAKVADGRPVSVKDEMSLCTLAAIVETVIGVEMDFTMEQWIQVRTHIDSGMHLVFTRMSRPWLLIDWIYGLTEGGRQLATIRRVNGETFEKTFADQSHQFKTNAAQPSDPTKVQSYFTIMLEALAAGTEPVTEAQIREECFILAVAGMDTTASTMSYVLMLLGIHPAYQHLLLAEQHAIFHDSLKPATFDDIANMPLLEHVVKETLRLFPPVSLMPREIPVDIAISNGLVVPAGSAAYIFNFGIHRSAAYFAEPDRFWPERWTPENSVGRHPCAFLPFSAGARNCVGQKYAFLQMKATLSRVLRQFRFESGYTMKELQRIQLSACNISAVGYDVQIFPR